MIYTNITKPVCAYTYTECICVYRGGEQMEGRETLPVIIFLKYLSQIVVSNSKESGQDRSSRKSPLALRHIKQAYSLKFPRTMQRITIGSPNTLCQHTA